MPLPWLPVVWLDIIASVLTLLLAAFCGRAALHLIKSKHDQTFFNCR